MEKVQVTKEVCSLSEDILKTNKVQFSDEYQPPVYPNWTQQIAEEVGCSQQYVAKVVTTNKSESDNLVVSPTLQSRTDKADFRKLPAELQQKVAAKEVSLNAAAIQAEYEKAKAKERQALRKGNQAGADNHGNVSIVDPMPKRDAIGARVGVSDPGHLRQNSPRRLRLTRSGELPWESSRDAWWMR